MAIQTFWATALLSVALTSLLTDARACFTGLIRFGKCSGSNVLLAKEPDSTTKRQDTSTNILRTKQIRPNAKNRKPSGYWHKIDNMERELREFWRVDCQVDVDPSVPPAIPSNLLLSHFGREDLRNAIAVRGSDYLAKKLGGAEIIPGKWKEAVKESTIVQELIRNENYGLHPEMSPLSPQQKKALMANEETALVVHDLEERNKRRWKHNRENRRPKSYWTTQIIVQHLYEYLEERQEDRGLPAVWMPRLIELENQGRDDLKSAICRFGGVETCRRMAGLVSYRDWSYFDGQLQLMTELRDYIAEHHPDDTGTFPRAIDIGENGHKDLLALVTRYGGRKFVARRYGLKHTTKNNNNDLEYGHFSLEFGIGLLVFVREQEMTKRAPLQRPSIGMPTGEALLKAERGDLIRGVQDFGGFESVARRLGLDWP